MISIFSLFHSILVEGTFYCAVHLPFATMGFAITRCPTMCLLLLAWGAEAEALLLSLAGAADVAPRASAEQEALGAALG